MDTRSHHQWLAPERPTEPKIARLVMLLAALMHLTGKREPDAPA